jgi:hypothetical protein
MLVHWNAVPGEPYLVLRWNTAAVDLDGTDAAERDVPGHRLALTVSGEQLILLRLLARLWRGTRGIGIGLPIDPALLDCVSVTILVVCAQHVPQLAHR